MGAKKPSVDVADYVDFLLDQPPMELVEKVDRLDDRKPAADIATA